MAYGFKDRKKAELLRDFAAEHLPLRIGERNGRFQPVDNGSRIYVVRLNADLPAATLVDGELTPGVTSCTIFEVPPRNPAEAATPRGGTSPLTRNVYNLRRRTIPAEPSMWYTAVEDSFGALLLVEDGKPDMYGTLSASMTGEQSTTVEVTLAAGQSWLGSETLDCLPAPNIPSSVTVESGEKVVCHWMDFMGEGGAWVAIPFRRGGGSDDYAIVQTFGTGSPSASRGYCGRKQVAEGSSFVGTECVFLFLAQLSESSPRPTQRFFAHRETVESTQASGADAYYSVPTYVTLPPAFLVGINADLMASDAAALTTQILTDENSVIYPGGKSRFRATSYGWVITDGLFCPRIIVDGTALTPVYEDVDGYCWYRDINGYHRFYHTPEYGWVYTQTLQPGQTPYEYSYSDNGTTMWGGDSFYSTSPGSTDTGSSGGTRITDTLTFIGRGSLRTDDNTNTVTITFDFPRWQCDTAFGKYINVADDTDIIEYGQPVWTIVMNGETVGEFGRGRTRREVNGNYVYHGTLTVGDNQYQDITYSSAANPSGWILGTFGSDDGWYQCETPLSDGELSLDQTRTFVFSVKVEQNIRLSWSDYIVNGNRVIVDGVNYGAITYQAANTEMGTPEMWKINGANPEVTWWESTSSVMSTPVTFVCSDINNNPVVITWSDYIVNGNRVIVDGVNYGAITYQAANTEMGTPEMWTIGEYGSETGWYQATDSTMSEVANYEYTHVPREDVVLEFDHWGRGNDTAEVWIGNVDVWE